MMRISTSGNPLGLRIGEAVEVRQGCTIAYDGDQKRFFFEDFNRTAIVIGSVKRAIGTYVPGSVSYSLDGSPDECPSYLKVSKYVRLYECRTAIGGRSFLVRPDDITMP
jgi:hypothetical protein